MPSKLVKSEIPATFILFVNLIVEPPELLRRRLFNKTKDILKQHEYTRYLDEIVATSNQIEEDFGKIKTVESRVKIHTINLRNNDSRKKTTKAIVRKIHDIVKENN